MKTLLICPSPAPALRLLAEAGPLATVPLLGQGIIEYWLSHAANNGVKEVSILSHDRTEQVEALVENGARWGLKLNLIEETRELTPGQARATYEQHLDADAPREAVALMDHFPGENTPLFTSYPQLFQALREWMPKALTTDRVGAMELQPGIWTGVNASISPQAKLQAPCWVGKNVFVGPHATIGPGTIIEDGCFIERASTITGSRIAAYTFVGEGLAINNSLAFGDMLVDAQTGQATRIPDQFVLCALRQPRTQDVNSWFARLAEICCRNKAEAQLLWKHLLINRGS